MISFRHCLSAAAVLIAPTVALAADEGFKPLFNGKDLSGWVQPAEGSGATFTVEDGAIVGRTDGKLKKNEFLVTGKAYGDFILKAKVKIRNGNSGIQFRSTREPNGRVTGPQADVADGYWGLLYEEGRRGMLNPKFDKAAVSKIIKEGDWNEFTIEAKDHHVVIAINGTKVVDMDDEKFEHSGIIALQVHVGPAMQVSYKDIEIKTLD